MARDVPRSGSGLDGRPFGRRATRRSTATRMKPLLLLLALCTAAFAATESLPKTDQRADVIRDLNTPRAFPAIASRADWKARAQDIRENTLVSCGLWPLPEKTPLKPRISPPTKHDGVAV